MNNVKFYFLFADRNTGLYQPHLGSDYLISLLQSQGFQACRILTKNNEMLEKRIEEIKTSEMEVQYAFGFTCYDANYQMVKQAIQLIRKNFPLSIIFIGGPSASFNDDVILKSIRGIDLCFLGESEKSIIEFAKRVVERKNFFGIPNTSYLENGHVISLGANCVLEESDMNAFPSAICSPQYDPVEILERYGKISIITSRGCPHRCSFCAFSLQSNHIVRYYSVERVIKEIQYIDEKLSDIMDINLKKVVIEDDCFTLDKKHFLGIIDNLIEIKPNLVFECETRADYLDYDTLKQLKKAGFYRVDISLESVSEEVLVANNKVYSFVKAQEYVDKVEKVIKWCKELSIECYTTLMCGLPGDKVELTEKTYKFIMSNKPSGYFWNNLKVFTGTSLYEKYMRKIVNRDENIFNPVFCNDITYNLISPYHPKNVERKGDDVSWINRKERTKRDVFEYLTGEKVMHSCLFRVDWPFGFKKYIHNLVEAFPLDTRMLLFEIDEENCRVTSVLLSEVQAVAMFEMNTDEQVYLALKEMAPPVVLPQKDFFEKDSVIGLENKENIKGLRFLSNCTSAINKSRELRQQLLDVLIYLNGI